ncbi:hypothetical protein BJV78DRAFT_618718 [Lactifluus subvellereus]|nr:hypothetical protein BJV78DRAFT_618718 [Lactifluus subvellereus]
MPAELVSLHPSNLCAALQVAPRTTSRPFFMFCGPFQHPFRGRTERCKIESGGHGNDLPKASERLRDIMRDGLCCSLMIAHRFQFTCCQLDFLRRCRAGRIRRALNDLPRILGCVDGLVEAASLRFSQTQHWQNVTGHHHNPKRREGRLEASRRCSVISVFVKGGFITLKDHAISFEKLVRLLRLH